MNSQSRKGIKMGLLIVLQKRVSITASFISDISSRILSQRGGIVNFHSISRVCRFTVIVEHQPIVSGQGPLRSIQVSHDFGDHGLQVMSPNSIASGEIPV